MRRAIKNNFFIVAFLSLLLPFYSCSERESYYHFNELKNADWAIDQALSFDIDSVVLEVGVSYDMSLELTNNVDYPYRNLWVVIEILEQDSMIFEKEMEIFLADRYAKWEGAGFGSLYQSSHMIGRLPVFTQKKDRQISVRHKMKDKSLHGIEKLGIKIQKQTD